MAIFKKIIKAILAISIFCFLLSLVFRERLPDRENILKQLYQKPAMVKINKTPFEVERGGISYSVKPLYRYELYGLIVACHESSSIFDFYHN